MDYGKINLIKDEWGRRFGKPSPVAQRPMEALSVGTLSIPLSQGKVAIIDEEDAERVLTHKWSAARADQVRENWYAHRQEWVGGVRRTVYLHRFIMGEPLGMLIDHEDGDGLNCRKGNLRLATRADNNRNQHRRTKNTSGFKGVSFCSRSRTSSWEAYIHVSGKKKRIGHFRSAEEAAHAYDNEARQLFGPFARLNFPELGERKA